MILILFIGFIIVIWKLKQSYSLHYRFLGFFLRKSLRPSTETVQYQIEVSGSLNSSNSKNEKLLQAKYLGSKYKTGVSLLTKETTETSKQIPISNDSSVVKTREDVFFHLILAFNSLFFSKILTGWVQVDKFGYISETNINLWINLGSLIIFTILVLVQLFLMKKYQTKFQ
jgi:hypothetical protein